MPLDQHPIPQQITSYEFKLIGDMTIKQFGKAMAGIILGFLIYSTQLFILLKMPLALLAGGAGLAAAFVPFQDRPLEKWALAFVRSLYSPTLFIWKKQVNTNWLDIDYSKKYDPSDKDEEEAPRKELSKVEEFINSMPGRDSGQINLKDEEPERQTKRDVLLDDIVNEKKEEEEKKISSSGKDVEGLQIASTEITNLKLQREKLSATNLAEFGGIPMPDKPNFPNVLVGMVFDKIGKIVPDAIIEIQDESGNSARVLKTNSLGQFRTSTPLADGSYVLITQKDNFGFDRIKISFNNSIVDPIRIQATS